MILNTFSALIICCSRVLSSQITFLQGQTNQVDAQCCEQSKLIMDKRKKGNFSLFM